MRRSQNTNGVGGRKNFAKEKIRWTNFVTRNSHQIFPDRFKKSHQIFQARNLSSAKFVSFKNFPPWKGEPDFFNDNLNLFRVAQQNQKQIGLSIHLLGTTLRRNGCHWRSFTQNPSWKINASGTNGSFQNLSTGSSTFPSSGHSPSPRQRPCTSLR